MFNPALDMPRPDPAIINGPLLNSSTVIDYLFHFLGGSQIHAQPQSYGCDSMCQLSKAKSTLSPWSGLSPYLFWKDT